MTTDLGLFEAPQITFQARPLIQYELMSDDELAQGAGQILVFDVECFDNFFLIAFKDVISNKVLMFELGVSFDTFKLEWVLRNYTLVGFNSLKYDMPLAWLSLTTQDPKRLKAASNDLIAGQTYKFKVQPTQHIDLIEVCPLRGSLKLYGARLHAARIQDIPWGAEPALEDWQIPITRNYCVNDLDITKLLLQNLSEQLKLRTELSAKYGQDLMSKSDAQIAEAVIEKELLRLGTKIKKAPVQPGKVYKFMPPPNLSFNSNYMKDVLKTVCAAEFIVGDDGYLICPDTITDLEIGLGDSIYRMGIGGLHSSEKNQSCVAGGDYELFDRDVASYYPAIILNCGLVPKSLGENFLTVYRSLVERRLAAKKAGDQAVAECLKVTCNGCFGKLASPHSILYAPEMLLQITLSGQLYLLQLIELLETFGVNVISANTDGFIACCPKAKRQIMLTAVEEWQKATGFVTEETAYKAIYSRDVNAYLAIKSDGKVKGKNVYYDPWRSSNARDRFWCFQKNPNAQICVEAVEKFLVEGVALERTIKQCKDIKKFLAVKNVTGGAHKNGVYLGKVIRWYMARGVEGTINYITNNHQVPDTFEARPVMDLPLRFPADVNYSWYVKRAQEMLKDMNWREDQ